MGSLSGIRARTIAHWQKPAAGWIKLNVNGVMRLSNDHTSVAWVFRDSEARWIFGFEALEKDFADVEEVR